MRTRRVIAIVVAFLTLPFLLFGLIDPLEGGLSLLVAVGLGVAVWAVARVPVPRLLWISLIATVALGGLTLALAMITLEEATGTGTATNPILPVVGLVWLWRIGVLVVLAGALVYIVRLFRSLREPLSASPDVAS
ncbi:hypothetical protein [Microbacterium sulfonylureivorans]|uniref:hypothetical protein n=1 Tax=Microbacterium sulfonylureivorans TaxID=2486854 RepID=UPI000FD6CEE2|nr:hypothetical protein [Microbacterium sulfonylureivorans]